MGNYETGIRELTCKKGFRQHSSDQESNQPVANTHWRKSLSSSSCQLTAGQKSLIPCSDRCWPAATRTGRGKERLPSPLKGHSNPEEWHDSQLRLSQQKNHTQGGLKRQKRIFSQFGRLGASTQGRQHRQPPVASRRVPSPPLQGGKSNSLSSLVPLRSTRVLSDQVPPLMT